MRSVLMVETDLTLNPADPTFDETKVNSLLDACTSFFKTHQNSFDELEIEQIRAV